MKENKYFSVHRIALIGILAAAIFVLTKFVSIPIPSPLGKTALSVGNAMCILSALLFGPVTGRRRGQRPGGPLGPRLGAGVLDHLHQ